MAPKKFSYKEALEEISAIVQKIENEEVDVDELSAQVKKAAALIGACKAKLRDTSSELEAIIDKLDT
jgi:exodeoxyribonuclease VII small subunit